MSEMIDESYNQQADDLDASAPEPYESGALDGGSVALLGFDGDAFQRPGLDVGMTTGEQGAGGFDGTALGADVGGGMTANAGGAPYSTTGTEGANVSEPSDQHTAPPVEDDGLAKIGNWMAHRAAEAYDAVEAIKYATTGEGHGQSFPLLIPESLLKQIAEDAGVPHPEDGA